MRNYFNNNKKNPNTANLLNQLSLGVGLYVELECFIWWCRNYTPVMPKLKKTHSLSVSDLFQHLTIVSLSASEPWEAKHFWDRSAFARWPETGDSPFPPSALIFWMVLPGFCHSGLLICHFQSFSTGEKFTQLQNRSSQRYAAHSYRHTLCGIGYT